MLKKIFGKPKCSPFVKVAILAAMLVSSLTGCALYNSVITGKPLDQAQVQVDLAIAKQGMIDAGCLTAEAAAVAAPILAVTTDAAGQKVFQAVDAGGNVLCRIPANTPLPAGTLLVPNTPPK